MTTPQVSTTTQRLQTFSDDDKDAIAYFFMRLQNTYGTAKMQSQWPDSESLSLARREFGAQFLSGGPWCSFISPKTGREIIIKDVIADAMLQDYQGQVARIYKINHKRFHMVTHKRDIVCFFSLFSFRNSCFLKYCVAWRFSSFLLR